MRADTIAERLRKARKSTVEVDGHVFTIRRPTDSEANRITLQQPSEVAVCREYVCGWDDSVTEAAVGIVSGGSDPIPFSYEIWREWVDDRPDFWVPIYEAIVDAYNKHNEILVNSGKLSPLLSKSPNSETAETSAPASH